MSKDKPLIVLLSDLSQHKILLKHKLSNKFHITTLSSEDFSIASILNLSPDYILIHDHMFKAKIFSICRTLRQTKDLLGTPIFILTGVLQKSYLDKLIHYGVTDFIREPLDEKDIEELFLNSQKFRSIQLKMDKISPSIATQSSYQKHHMIEMSSMKEIQGAFKENKLSVLSIQIDQELKDQEREQSNFLKILSEYQTKDNWLFDVAHGKFLFVINLSNRIEAFSLCEKIRIKVLHETDYTVSIGLSCSQNKSYTDLKELLADSKCALTKALKIGNQTQEKV